MKHPVSPSCQFQGHTDICELNKTWSQTIYLPKWTTGFTSWVLLRWLQFPFLDFFSYLYDPSSNWSLNSFPDSAQVKFLLGMHRTVAVIWDISSAFWYASFCVMEFIITMTQSNTDKNAQAFVHSDAANVHCGHILKLLLHGGAVCYKKQKQKQKNKLKKGIPSLLSWFRVIFPSVPQILKSRLCSILLC